MRTIEKFIYNLDSSDIHLVDKLDNLCGHGQISEDVCEMARYYDTFLDIQDYIKEILQDDIGNTKLAEKYIKFIVDETESLYEQGLIDEPDDFTGGLYNCDDLYLYAIADVLDIDIDDLECYGEEEDDE